MRTPSSGAWSMVLCEMSSDRDSNQRIALVDCNAFYVSCETVFNPALRGKSVVVLSNNDGCVVARSPQAKAFKIKMAQPWHQVPKAVRQQSIAYSSNYTLYADMSERVMTILRDMAPYQEVYSIDESFLDLSGIQHLHAHCHAIRQRVGQWTGLPVCVGIGSTKTRAKLANYVAKRYPRFQGVFDLEDLPTERQTKLFAQLPINEVWGVGRQTARKLQQQGIATVAQLRDADPKVIRQQFGVVVERTIAELNGVGCLDLESVTPPRQQIRSSRTFGRSIHDLTSLKSAVLSYVSRAAEKLRSQGSTARAMNVFITTNVFKPDLPQYTNSITVKLPTATDDTRTLAKYAGRAVEQLFRSGFEYKKAGLNLMQLEPKASRQMALLNVPDDARQSRLNNALDQLNQRFGQDRVRLGCTVSAQAWSMNRRNLSPSYTTDVHQLIAAS